MYNTEVKTQEQAIAHLFFHCCLKDGVFKEAEIDNISGKLVAAGFHKSINIKEEVKRYNAYRASIGDENTYLQYLIQLIRPTNELALYSYCMELCLSDADLSNEEEALLEKIAYVLTIPDAERTTTQKLLVQRKVVETEKLF
jgi:uncharacterized tellurite resistance protein B-like protein